MASQPSLNPADYPNHGMAAPFWVVYLAGYLMPFMSQEWVASFADAITVAKAGDVPFVKEQIKSFLDTLVFDSFVQRLPMSGYTYYLNATSLANLYYLLLHTPDDQVKAQLRFLTSMYKRMHAVFVVSVLLCLLLSTVALLLSKKFSDLSKAFLATAFPLALFLMSSELAKYENRMWNSPEGSAILLANNIARGSR